MPFETTAAPRQHAYAGPVPPQPAEPSHAERVKTLASVQSVAVLSTMSRRQPGFPFGSLMPFALDGLGRAIFLISNMAMHTQNLKADGRASLFFSQAAANDDPLGSARATLIGTVIPVLSEDLGLARELYLGRHESSRYWVDFADFGFFRLEPLDVYYVGGFGVMGWVTGEEYREASPDPLAAVAPGILAHMNADHVPAMILLAKHHALMEATEAAMTSVDRLGFSLRLKTGEGMKAVRINFPREVRASGEARTALIEMVQAVR